ncbi:TIGR02680 family protein [Nocardiopsis mwathae]|uniref:TIGR02680 family protein n=1 Tax=Nocardiopsis mwathae TaxID=1472723 RepID=UPI0031B5695F
MSGGESPSTSAIEQAEASMSDTDDPIASVMRQVRSMGPAKGGDDEATTPAAVNAAGGSAAAEGTGADLLAEPGEPLPAGDTSDPAAATGVLDGPAPGRAATPTVETGTAEDTDEPTGGEPGTDTASASPPSGAAEGSRAADGRDADPACRYRLKRAGIRNVWQYDDHTFDFADGRLLLRGRNGTGKSKALEMLLPFLLDGDARRLDTTGTSRTSLRWLMLDGRTPVGGDGEADADTGPDAGTDDDADPATSLLGYLWVEFALDGEAPGGAAAPATPAGDPLPAHLTLGAAITASADAGARSVFFVTDRRIGADDLSLIVDDRPMPVDRLRTEVGPDNCYDTPVAYRSRVMRELFGIDDPVRYRNLIHLLYRLRRPTIGERLEAGELVSVLAEALPPMDETVLDEVARNIADLEEARERLASLGTAREQVADFLDDYRGYLRGALRTEARAVREQIGEYRRRDAEVVRLTDELDRLVAAESTVQEERDRLRRTRDTAASDADTLSAGAIAEAGITPQEHEARQAAVNAYIRAAEAAWTAAGYALVSEERAKERMAFDISAIERSLAGLQRLHTEMAETARTGGIDPAALGEVPQPVPTILAPRESVTHVDLEGLEQAVEREPVPGIDLPELRGRLAELHDRLGYLDAAALSRSEAAAGLRERAVERAAAERREAALDGEAEAAEAALERAAERELSAIEGVRTASADYADRVRAWTARLREVAPDADLTEAVAALEEHVELPLDDARRVLDADVPASLAARVHAVVDPLLRDLRTRRDTAVGEERELAGELDDLSERKRSGTDHLAVDRPQWATAPRRPGVGIAFHRAVEFAPELTTAERAGLEAALEAAGLLSGWITADGAVVDPGTRDLILTPSRQANGRTLLDALTPGDMGDSGVAPRTVEALLCSIGLLPAPGEEVIDVRPRHRRDSASPPASAVSLDGRWRLGVASGAHFKSSPEYIGADVRAETDSRHLANIDRRIDIAEALLAEVGERRSDVEQRHAALVATVRDLPGPGQLAAAWAALDNARSWLAAAKRDHAAATEAAAEARSRALALRSEMADPSAEHALPTAPDRLTAALTVLDRLRVQIAAAYRDLEALAVQLEEYQRHTADWEHTRNDRIIAEDARTAAIGDMITVRRQIELTDRARVAAPEQIDTAVGEVRGRMEEAEERLPEAERAAQQARDDRVAAETRLDTAVFERAGQARRAHTAGAALHRMIEDADGSPDTTLLAAAGLADVAVLAGTDVADAADDAEGPGGPERADAAGGAEEGQDTDAAAAAHAEDDALAARVRELDALVTAIEAELGDGGDDDPRIDDSGILRRREELHRLLASSGAVGARTELTEPLGLKRVTVHDDGGSHDITHYARRLDEAIAHAEEEVLLREEEAFERHLLGELAGHLAQQIDAARALISSMNGVLGDVTTSQGLGVRLEWDLAPDADEDIQAVVPLLARPAAQRTRVESTRLRDALRRCIEAIRRLDPTATGGAQLRAALDYRSWFAFTVYVTNAAHPERERRLSHRTALSQGEQRVIAYLVLFAAAAAQFDALAEHAPAAPRLILLDDAFAKVDEPTHGRLLGLLVELDLDFVLTSERVWGCFPSVPSLHIYECLRDPAVPGIATLHFSWDGRRRRLVGV